MQGERKICIVGVKNSLELVYWTLQYFLIDDSWFFSFWNLKNKKSCLWYWDQTIVSVKGWLICLTYHKGGVVLSILFCNDVANSDSILIAQRVHKEKAFAIACVDGVATHCAKTQIVLSTQVFSFSHLLFFFFLIHL